MKTADIRRTFLEFFRARDHRVVPSSSLIPDDPAAPLLTTAGMVQFIPYLNGSKPIEFPRAASCQKSARTTDIEVVGTDARHLTLFQMLGNFSFGDYFKEDAIKWAWELSLDGFGMEPDRIWATVLDTDDEAARIWRDVVGVPDERIIRRPRPPDDNFWWMGIPGPGGPCSELYYDRGPKYGDAVGFQEGDRILEYWNLVFTEFEVDENGQPVANLPQKNVDTGLGLERLATILQDVPGIFETDDFQALIARAEELSGRRYTARYDPDARDDTSLRILAEHARFATFLIGDGVFPSNEGRGYVLRRVIRRAVRHARLLDVEDTIMPALVDAVVQTMGDVYPEIVSNKEMIKTTAGTEEESFRRTLRSGLVLLEEDIGRAKKAGASRLKGEDAFKLHDTYGFPLELTLEIAAEEGLDVDTAGFEGLMEQQRRRAQEARKEMRGVTGEAALQEILAERGPTKFLGYDRTETESVLAGIVRDGERTQAAGEGDEIEVVLDATSFYPEGGGQVGDTGVITLEGAVLEVLDTQTALGDLIVHRALVKSGEARVDAGAHAVVDASRRAAVMRSHTATHVLHATLRQALGPHAHQAGSLVDAGRLRFDFPHTEAVPRDLLAEVEDTVNRRVLADDLVRPYETTREEAAAIGAIALFGEKYGDIVRVVEIGAYSVELCGGTHCTHTSQVGLVKILGEASIGSGLRRVEALTGTDAIEGYRHDRRLLEEIAALVRGTPDEAADKVRRMLDDLKAARGQLEKAERSGAKDQAGALAAKAHAVGDAKLVAEEIPGLDVGALRSLAALVRDKLGTGVVILGRRNGGANVVAAVSKDLVGRGLKAGALAATASQRLGGKGGGKDDLAIGGGKDADALPQALQAAADAAKEQLA